MSVKKKNIIVAILIIISNVIIDQITKALIVGNMKLHSSIPLIKGKNGSIFELNYIHNKGAAWGIFSKQTALLTIISIIVMTAVGYVFWNIKEARKFRILRISIALLIGGAIGNMIDRIRLHYVIDFLYFRLIDFPVFNYADICVTVALFLIIFSMIFKYKTDDFDVCLGDKKYDEKTDTYVSVREKK